MIILNISHKNNRFRKIYTNHTFYNKSNEKRSRREVLPSGALDLFACTDCLARLKNCG